MQDIKMRKSNSVPGNFFHSILIDSINPNIWPSCPSKNPPSARNPAGICCVHYKDLKNGAGARLVKNFLPKSNHPKISKRGAKEFLRLKTNLKVDWQGSPARSPLLMKGHIKQ